MVLFETTTALPQDDSALESNTKDMDMNASTTQHTEEGSDGVDDDASEEHGNDANGDDSSGDDSDGDSAADGERAFGAFKSNANKNLSESGTASTRPSIHRCNSWTSFLTRSERHRECPEEAPPKEEMAQRKVQFRDDPELEEVRVLELDPPLTSTEKNQCHLSDTDNDRMQLEVKMTFLRWDHHEDGQIEFDENQHSIRGLIDHVDEHCPERNRDSDINNHMNRVLQEQHSQRIAGTWLDQERVGEIARASAGNDLERAQYIAQRDRIAMEEAWEAPAPKNDTFYSKKKASESVVVEKKKRRERRGNTGDRSNVGNSLFITRDKAKKDKPPKEKKKGLGKLAFWK
jgi:hypothetical protein